MTYLEMWLQYCRGMGGFSAFPLAAAGILMMVAGWRLGRASIVIAYSTIGGSIGWFLGPVVGLPGMSALISATGLALALLLPSRYATSTLGGIMGSLVSLAVFQSWGLEGGALGTAAAAAFVVTFALSWIHERQVLILVTALHGGALILSAMFALGGYSPNTFRSICGVIEKSGLLMFFSFVSPTVIGCALQATDVNQKESGISRID